MSGYLFSGEALADDLGVAVNHEVAASGRVGSCLDAQASLQTL